MSRRAKVRKPCPYPGCPELVNVHKSEFCWAHFSLMPRALQLELRTTWQREGYAAVVKKRPMYVKAIERALANGAKPAGVFRASALAAPAPMMPRIPGEGGGE